MSPRAVLAAVAIAAFACRPEPGARHASGESAGDGAADAGAVANPARLTPTRFDDHYDAHSWVRNRCDRALRITGSEPMEPGGYPVAIFLVGTSGEHDYPGIVENVLPALAREGLVAASLEYENGTLFGAAQGCALYRDNASCMVRNPADHVDGGRRSALARLCGREKADCGAGVVFLGHSQGGLTAVQAFRFAPVAPPPPARAPRLEAVAPMGVGPVGYALGKAVLDLRECMAAEALPLAPDRMLVVNGESDAFFNGAGGDQAGGQAALEAVTGRRCAAKTWDCRGSEGGGWILVKGSEVSTGHAGHEYMSAPGASFAEPEWVSPDAGAWALPEIARWLAQQVRR